MKKEYRDYANELARQVCRQFNIMTPPQCTRITRRRGRANWWTNTFTIPLWAICAHPAYRDYYITHEVLHFHPIYRSHGPAFHRNEQLIAESMGHRLVFQDGDPYPIEIRELKTGHPICDRYGRAI